MKAIYIFLVFTCFAYSASSSAWIIDANFDGGVAGERADGPSGITEAFAQTVYTTERSLAGGMAMKATIDAYSEGFGDWGGNWRLSSSQRLGEGDEIWYRVWLYIPDDFSFSCGCTEGPKFMRIHTQSPDGNNEGYWNLHLLEAGILMATSVTDDFYSNHPYPHDDIRRINGGLEKGSWHAYEQYVKFSSTPGQGVYRTWYDGNLIFEDTVTKTLRSANSRVDSIQLFTYWRSKREEQPEQTQSLFVDEVIITNERPDQTDAYGNHYIGIGDTTFTVKSPPNAPSNLSITVIPQ